MAKESREPGWKLGEMHHIGLTVSDIERSIRFYLTAGPTEYGSLHERISDDSSTTRRSRHAGPGRRGIGAKFFVHHPGGRRTTCRLSINCCLPIPTIPTIPTIPRSPCQLGNCGDCGNIGDRVLKYAASLTGEGPPRSPSSPLSLAAPGLNPIPTIPTMPQPPASW